MATILIPGRHLVTSAFMVDYLQSLLEEGIAAHPVMGAWQGDDVIDHVVIPITSSNQRGSRYNPVPLYARVIGLERTCAPFRVSHNVRISFIPIPHVGQSEKFAALTLKYVAAHLTETITPQNTIVWCSTEGVYLQYQALGFSVLPAEFDPITKRYSALAPNEILSALTAAPLAYQTLPEYGLLSEATRTLWQDMPEIPEHIMRLWNDPLLTDSGSLTEERNYATYSVGMSHTALMDINLMTLRMPSLRARLRMRGVPMAH